MKKFILFSVAFVAVFVVSLKLYAASKSVKPPHYYCRYDKTIDACHKNADGSACYLVNEDCSWIDY